MKTIGVLFTIMTTLVTSSLGQTDLPKHYCQGCCGCITIYYLKLDVAAKFELYYSNGDKIKDDSSFGLGTFDITNDILTLSFENIPQDGIDLRKISSSDSLLIHFSVFDNVRSDNVPLFVVGFKSGGKFLYSNPGGTIGTRFNGPEIINFSSPGFRNLSYFLAELGEYEMKVRLNPEGTTYLKQGDKKEFKIIREKEIKYFQDLDNKKLKFTTKSCGC